MKKSSFLSVLGFFASVFLAVSFATPGLAREIEIEINNPGFEDPPYADGAWGPTDGWTLGYYTLPDTTTWEPEEFAENESHGGFDPSAAEGYGGVAPEGENVLYTSSFAGYDAGVSQVLSATLEANSQYELSVLVGNPAPYNGGLTADYRIELLAGGVLLASDTGPSPVDDTTWTTASLTYNSGANPAQLGQPLEIRLLAVDFADWYEVHYDNVTLTQESLVPWPLAYGPEPGQGEMIEATAQLLGWKSGDFAVSHNVYLGDNFDDVNQATPEDDAFMGNQSETVFLAQGLTPGATYYWRVDEVNDTHPDSPWKGDVWDFHVRPAIAWAPSPADGTQYVHPDQDLTWEPGLGSIFHKVFFGETFEEVESAADMDYMTVEPTYDPPTLDIGKTYYWRVDEFAGAEEYRGDIWSFTTVPAVAVTDPTLALWWTLDEAMGATAVDWSGHGHHGMVNGDARWADGYHGTALTFADDVYVEAAEYPGITGTDPRTLCAWIKTTTANRDIMSWGLNVAGQKWIMRIDATGGLRLEVNGGYHYGVTNLADGRWHHVAVTFVDDGSPDVLDTLLYVDGQLDATADSLDEPIDTAAPGAVRIGESPWHNRPFAGEIDDARIYDKVLTADEIQQVMRGNPLLAGNPEPGRGAIMDIREATALRWSVGDTAVSHNVYFGTDRAAVATADTDAPEFQGNQPGTVFSLAGLVEWGGGDYFWRIDEVEAGGAVQTGYIWKFTVPPHLIVDNFESYDDEENQGTRIYETWADGWANAVYGGSQVGYTDAPFAETGIVYGGAQSMPLQYDNTTGPGYSEADRTFSPAQDWTVEGVTTLVVHFRGLPDNAGQLYVKINGTKVPYDGDPADIATARWFVWDIDLASVGTNLKKVTTLTIGIEGGETGVLYIDEIVLTKP